MDEERQGTGSKKMKNSDRYAKIVQDLQMEDR